MSVVEQIRKILKTNMQLQRELKGWNQDDLAEKSGLSIGYIKKIETGRQWPQPTSVEAIARAFGVEASLLFSDPEKVPREDTLIKELQKAFASAGYEITKKN